MEISRAFAESSKLGLPGGYIYLIFTPLARIAYVGQTRNAYGPIGRLAQHISDTESNTFLQRFAAILKLDKAEVKGIFFFAASLPLEKRFTDGPSEYREAVEAVVQSCLLNLIFEKKIRATLVSRVRLNAYSSEFDIKIIANSIAEKFADLLSEEHPIC